MLCHAWHGRPAWSAQGLWRSEYAVALIETRLAVRSTPSARGTDKVAYDCSAYALGRAIGGAFQDVLDIQEARRVQGIIDQLAAERDRALVLLNQMINERDEALALRDHAQAQRDRAQAERSEAIEAQESAASRRNRPTTTYDPYRDAQLIKTLRDLVRHRARSAVYFSALADIAPTHPLVIDSSVRETVSKAGEVEWTFYSDQLGLVIPDGNPRLIAPGSIWKKVDAAARARYRSLLRSTGTATTHVVSD